MSDPQLTPMLTIFAILFGGLMAILWALLPFAIFGIKPILREIRDELRRR